MQHSSIYSAEGRYRIIDSVLSDQDCQQAIDLLDDSDDWTIAGVTDNGSTYLVMPTIRRQKIIEREDADEATSALLDKVERLALDQIAEDGFDPSDIEISMSQLIRSDVSDFFIWHTDGKPHLPRVRSYLFFFNDDYIGGDIEFWNGEGAEPLIKHLDAGSCLSYESVVHSRHHKVLRGTCFAALVIVGRNEEAQAKYDEERQAEEDSSS